MAPPPIQKVRLLNTLYNVEIITGDMVYITEQIQSKKETIMMLNSQLSSETRDLNELQTQLITLYIQQTGAFPPS
jgi:hypothetical protein